MLVQCRSWHILCVPFRNEKGHVVHVIVMGAGLGGLALAQGLRRAGISVAVYEKDTAPKFRNQGYRIRINADGIRALQAVLTPEAFEVFAATSGNPGPGLKGFDHQLTPVNAMELPVIDGLPGGGNLAVNRMTLREILLSDLSDAVHFGACLSHYTASGTVTAHFTDGRTATGDVLVGADGVHSPTRRQLLPDAQVVDAGLRLLYGKVPLASAQVPPELLGLWTTIIGPDKRFVGLGPVRYPAPFAQVSTDIQLTDDTDYLTCVVGARYSLFPDDLAGRDLQALALSLLDGWHPQVREIVASQDPATIFPVNVRTSVPMPPWPTTNVTLLGDAIHAMSPAIGVGANTALRDAQVLAGRLASYPWAEALRGYEEEMLDYGFAAVRESAERGHQLVGQDPLPLVGS